MHKDWKGQEIKVGSIVKHRYEPLPAGALTARREEAHRFHNFAGTSEVVLLHGASVEVRRTNRNHIPVHIPELLEVVG